MLCGIALLLGGNALHCVLCLYTFDLSCVVLCYVMWYSIVHDVELVCMVWCCVVLCCAVLCCVVWCCVVLCGGVVLYTFSLRGLAAPTDRLMTQDGRLTPLALLHSDLCGYADRS